MWGDLGAVAGKVGVVAGAGKPCEVRERRCGDVGVAVLVHVHVRPVQCVPCKCHSGFHNSTTLDGSGSKTAGFFQFSFDSSGMAMEMEINSNVSQQFKDEDLFKAVESGDSSLFKSLTEEQLIRALSLRNEDGRSLVHVAVSCSQTEVVEILLAVNSSVVNSSDEEGWAPLHSAASSGNFEIVEILLNRGAEVNLKNDSGRTALHYAASKGRLKIAEILISHGAKLNLKDKIGCTPLHRAASTGNAELCEFLIEEGAEVDDVDKAGQTPLMTAVECHNKEVALLLIRHGADVDVEDKEGYTVLGRASDDLRPILVDAAKAMLEG